MEISVGDYVRTKCGIAKLNRIDNGYQYFLDSDIYDEDTLENTCVTYIKYITKHSKDIIDLVEAGDYVNGFRVEMIENGIIVFGVDEGRELFRNYFKYNPIKSIVTHEQFEEMSYKL